MTQDVRVAEILLVEDNEGDIELTREAFGDAIFRNNLHIAEDGDIALDYLYKRNGYETAVLPDIILLDLNLPSTDGKEVLQIVKSDPLLRKIPVIVLTSSEADKDVMESYDLHANWYIVKPVNASKFMKVVKDVEKFWSDIVCLPSSHR
ncbi:response regulator [Colwellia sp. 6M3]|uniref:response regulator n=1 Tax=Colwellia sp. 6M3 TaxID=2759849 RepID=UPI001C7170A9|nr:response regulator [Colwellia sp. 6M3]